MARVTVRQATPEDAGEIAAIHVRAWRAAYRGLLPDAVLAGLSVERRERTWRALLDEPDDRSFTLVASRDGQVAGFCSVATPSRDRDADPGTAEIGAIYVDPDHWSRGVGTALLDAAMRELRRSAWRDVTLWVFDRNEHARSFYARFGFARDGGELRDEDSGELEVRLRASLGRG